MAVTPPSRPRRRRLPQTRTVIAAYARTGLLPAQRLLWDSLDWYACPLGALYVATRRIGKPRKRTDRLGMDGVNVIGWAARRYGRTAVDDFMAGFDDFAATRPPIGARGTAAYRRGYAIAAAVRQAIGLRA